MIAVYLIGGTAGLILAVLLTWIFVAAIWMLEAFYDIGTLKTIASDSKALNCKTNLFEAIVLNAPVKWNEIEPEKGDIEWIETQTETPAMKAGEFTARKCA